MVYRFGDIVKFKFKPKSLGIEGDEVTLVGVIEGTMRQENRYIVQLFDDDRKIHGSLSVPWNQIIQKVDV